MIVEPALVFYGTCLPAGRPLRLPRRGARRRNSGSHSLTNAFFIKPLLAPPKGGVSTHSPEADSDLLKILFNNKDPLNPSNGGVWGGLVF